MKYAIEVVLWKNWQSKARSFSERVDKKQTLICQTLLSGEMEAVQEKVLFFNVNISYILYI
jgi:hypothetical protein